VNSISDTVGGLAQKWGEVLLVVVGLLVVVSVIQTYIRTRSWVPTIGVILIGAAALWGVSNVPRLQQSVQSEIQQAPTYRGPQNPGG
jgi:hypothetical protein